MFKSAQTFTDGFLKLLSTHPIHIVVWGNFPFKTWNTTTPVTRLARSACTEVVLRSSDRPMPSELCYFACSLILIFNDEKEFYTYTIKSKTYLKLRNIILKCIQDENRTFKVDETPLNLEIRLHANQVGTNARSVTEITFTLIWLARS